MERQPTSSRWLLKVLSSVRVQPVTIETTLSAQLVQSLGMAAFSPMISLTFAWCGAIIAAKKCSETALATIKGSTMDKS